MSIPEEQWFCHYSAVFGSCDSNLETGSDALLKNRLGPLLHKHKMFLVSKNYVVHVIWLLRHCKAPSLDGITPHDLQMQMHYLLII